VQHRATTRKSGRHRTGSHRTGSHRRTEALQTHRVPQPPRLPLPTVATLALAGRTRHAALTATLVAGVTIAGVSAAAPAGLAHPMPAHRTTQVTRGMSATGMSPNAAEAQAAATDVDEAPRGGTLSWKAPTHKQRPAATATTATTTAAWVNPLPEAVVTSCFGERWGRLHAGVDLAAPYGTPIRAAGAGTVIAAGPTEGYGNAVLIDHHNGYLTHYGHMSEIKVKPGQQVTTGQQIGNEGSTGHSTGPHLHFEVHKGTYKNPIDPTEWLHQHAVQIPGCPPPPTRTDKDPHPTD
jgi:murein DD-endopeptidase MepM/ murein hydrolase activator NlpD